MWIDGTNNGTTFYDQSGNNNPATQTNNPVTTRILQYRTTAFNGSSQYLSATNTFLSSFTAVSWGAWVKTTYSAADTEIMTSNTTNAVFTLRVAGGNPYFRVYAGGVGTVLNPSFNITDGSWHHVMGTWDGSTMTIFVD